MSVPAIRRQRVSVARAIATWPNNLPLNAPTAAPDGIALSKLHRGLLLLAKGQGSAADFGKSPTTFAGVVQGAVFAPSRSVEPGVLSPRTGTMTGSWSADHVRHGPFTRHRPIPMRRQRLTPTIWTACRALGRWQDVGIRHGC